LTDTTDLLADGGTTAASAEQDSPAAPRARRRATSGTGLAALVLPELQALAGQLGISGVARLRKSQLIEAIQERQASSGGASAPAPDAPASALPATDPPGVFGRDGSAGERPSEQGGDDRSPARSRVRGASHVCSYLTDLMYATSAFACDTGMFPIAVVMMPDE